MDSKSQSAIDGIAQILVSHLKTEAYIASLIKGTKGEFSGADIINEVMAKSQAKETPHNKR